MAHVTLNVHIDEDTTWSGVVTAVARRLRIDDAALADMNPAQKRAMVANYLAGLLLREVGVSVGQEEFVEAKSRARARVTGLSITGE